MVYRKPTKKHVIGDEQLQNLQYVYSELPPFMHAKSPEATLVLAAYVCKYIGHYHRELGSNASRSAGEPTRDRGHLESMANAANKIELNYERLGQQRRDLLLTAYSTLGDADADEFSELESPEQILESDLRAVARLKAKCRQAQAEMVKCGGRHNSDEVRLIARVAQKARDLQLLDRLARGRTSRFHQLAIVVLELVDYKIDRADRLIDAAIDAIYQPSSRPRRRK